MWHTGGQRPSRVVVLYGDWSVTRSPTIVRGGHYTHTQDIYTHTQTMHCGGGVMFWRQESRCVLMMNESERDITSSPCQRDAPPSRSHPSWITMMILSEPRDMR